MKVNIIGAGNVASHLAKHLYSQNVEIATIYSKTINSALMLSKALNANYTTDASMVSNRVDLNIVAISDQYIENVVRVLPKHIPIVHTSGGISMSVLSEFNNYGILYPLQTFSKETAIVVSDIPFFIEAGNKRFETKLLNLTKKFFSEKAHLADSETRKYIHLSAVVTSNFLTYFMGVAEKILKSKKLPLEVLKPLLQETIRKSMINGPGNSLTGPAARGDLRLLQEYKDMISDNAFKEVFSIINQHISDKAFTVL